MIKMLLATMVACLTSLVSYAFEGTYDVKGYDPYDKKPYEGTLTIKKDKNGIFQANWDFMEGGKQYKDTGTGLKNDADKISFVFQGVMGSEELGIQLYKVKDTKTLEGPFVLIGRNLVGKETITKREDNE